TPTRELDYDGIAPIDMSGVNETSLVFNLPATSSDAYLEDDGGPLNNGVSQIRSNNGTFETTTFQNPTGTFPSLSINRGTATDTVHVGDLPDFTAGLSIGSNSSTNKFQDVVFTG